MGHRLRASLLAGAVTVGLVGGGLGLSTPARAVTFPNLTKLTPTAGWPTPTYANHFGLAQTGELFSSAAVGDVDGDGSPDIVAGFPDGTVQGWHTDGTRFLDYWTGPGAVQASPALVDLNGDGVLDILAANTAGDVVAFTASYQVLFRAHDGDGYHPNGVFSTPAAVDLDRDGQLDIVATSWDHHLHAWHLNGAELPGFPVFLQDTSWSSPAVADIDGDGWPEIVFGYDCAGVQGQNCYPTVGGYVGVVRHDGSWQPGWPRFYPGQVIWSSPAVVDLDGDGRPDIVVGTGNMPLSGGHQVLAFHADGSMLPGWPVNVGGRTPSSPAIGDLDGDGRPDVAIVADDGKLYAIRADGSLLFTPRCVANDLTNGCPLPIHASPSIADIDGDGRQEVVVGGEQWLNVVDRTGAISYRGDTISGTAPLTAAPTIASVGGKTWIVEVSGITDSSGEHGQVFVWTTNTAPGATPWPTFKHDIRRTATTYSDVTPPVASLGALATTNATTKTTVTWSATDAGTGVASFDVDVADNGGPWTRWIDRSAPSSRSGITASGSHDLYGLPGHTYSVRARARDGAANVSPWTATGQTLFAANATRAQPFFAAYALGAYGTLSGLDSPPANGPVWGLPIARGVAASPAGGGWTLDGWGGLHAFGGAPALAGNGWWPGQDVARGLAMSSDGTWGYTVDLFGGIHPIGGAPALAGTSWWPGLDLARGIALVPGSTKANPAGYVLDAWGGVHPFGSAPAVHHDGWWPGQDVLRGITVNPDGSGYVVDDWGGIHEFGGAAHAVSTAWFPGQDVIRGVISVGTAGQPSGWVVDSWGGTHPFGSAPALDGNYWGPWFGARAIAVAR